MFGILISAASTIFIDRPDQFRSPGMPITPIADSIRTERAPDARPDPPRGR